MNQQLAMRPEMTSGGSGRFQDQSDVLLQLAQRLLHLKHRVDAYETLCETEVAEIRLVLDEQTERLLVLLSQALKDKAPCTTARSSDESMSVTTRS